VFLIAPTNYRSQRAVLKLGAVPAGERTGLEGRRSLVFALERDTWRAGRAGAG